MSVLDCATPNCRARFDPTVEWVYGWRDPNSTADIFYVSGRIPLGHCPICRKPPPSPIGSVDP